MTIAAQDWKPDHCADCGLVHPSHSFSGWRGPWRCADCHKDAVAARAARKAA